MLCLDAAVIDGKKQRENIDDNCSEKLLYTLAFLFNQCSITGLKKKKLNINLLIQLFYIELQILEICLHSIPMIYNFQLARK